MRSQVRVLAWADVTWLVKRAARVGHGGAVVVRGDNARSQDSRHFGAVPPEAVLAVAFRLRGAA